MNCQCAYYIGHKSARCYCLVMAIWSGRLAAMAIRRWMARGDKHAHACNLFVSRLHFQSCSARGQNWEEHPNSGKMSYLRLGSPDPVSLLSFHDHGGCGPGLRGLRPLWREPTHARREEMRKRRSELRVNECSFLQRENLVCIRPYPYRTLATRCFMAGHALSPGRWDKAYPLPLTLKCSGYAS